MQLHITGDSIDVTDALHDYATKKFQALQKRDASITSVNVILTIEKVQQIAKATVHVAGKDIHASADAHDLYSAIDLLIDKLAHQITKHKSIAKDHHGAAHHGIAAAPLAE